MKCAPRYLVALLALAAPLRADNPIITDVFTADPAALVHEGTVYLYAGHDEAPPGHNGYVMKEWLCFSSTDMVNWTSHGAPLSLEDFAWAEANAWASHAIERDGTFYWYVSVWRGEGKGFAIGVARSDSPTGPFSDALGEPLVSSEMTPDPINPEGARVTWDDIDPAVFIDDDGQAYLFWGNTNLYWAKLKDNMVELDGPIEQIHLPRFVEAPWVHKRGDLYYLSYSWGFPERTAYATATSISGPWEYRGIIKHLAGNCNTNHQAIIEFKGRDYFIYHNGGTLTGGSHRRSVCIDYLHYNEDGTIRRILPTVEGVSSADEPLPERDALQQAGGSSADSVVVPPRILPRPVSDSHRGNPIIVDMYTADPAPLVHEDTLYIYTGHDIQNRTDPFFKMRDWYAFSTTDMLHYQKHGPLLSMEDFEWARADAFASHVIERGGKFYWYVSLRHKDIRRREGMAIGVAVSDSPTGPFKDPIGQALITDETPNSIVLNIDPAVYIDDDGQAYLFWGSWNEARVVKLKDNMIELDGEAQVVEAKNFFEAPFVHKRDGLYYLSYASGYPSTTEYSTSKSILGPWEYQGVINGLLPKSETNHQGIVEFKGNWYFIYHTADLPGGGVYRRSVAVDKLEYDNDGRIRMIERTETSVPALR